jgi:hypothetical protein
MLNGQPFNVGPNLCSALKVLRHTSKQRNLWIDALSINQSDDAERSAQVAIMSSIYRQAQGVEVWLGEETEGTAKLFAFLRSNKGDLFSALTLFDDISAEFLALSKRAYWKRVWIIQEVLSASATRLLCGNQFLPFDYFATACTRLWRMVSTVSWDVKDQSRNTLVKEIQLTAAYSISCLKARRVVQYNLATLIYLCISCGSECQDVRDKIYGILSLASGYDGIIPDYEKSPLEVYLEVIVGTRWMRGTVEFASVTYDWVLTEMKKLLNPYADGSLESYYALPQSSDTLSMFLRVDFGRMLKSGCIRIHPSSLILDTETEGSDGPYDFVHLDALVELESVNWVLKSSPSTLSCLCRTPRPALDYNGHLEGFYHHHFNTPNDGILNIWNERLTSDSRALNPSKWDDHLRAKTAEEILVRTHKGSFSGKKGRKLLTLNGVLTIGPHNVRQGDILCHLDGSTRGLVIVRHLPLDNAFELMGLAILIDRKRKT